MKLGLSLELLEGSDFPSRSCLLRMNEEEGVLGAPNYILEGNAAHKEQKNLTSLFGIIILTITESKMTLTSRIATLDYGELPFAHLCVPGIWWACWKCFLIQKVASNSDSRGGCS